MAHTIRHAHAHRLAAYRGGLPLDYAGRRDYRACGIWSADEALAATLDAEAAEWGDLFASEDDYFDGIDTDAYYGDDRDRADDLTDLAERAEIAAADRAERIADLDYDALCGWNAPTALVWSDWTDNTIYEQENA